MNFNISSLYNPIQESAVSLQGLLRDHFATKFLDRKIVLVAALIFSYLAVICVLIKLFSPKLTVQTKSENEKVNSLMSTIEQNTSKNTEQALLSQEKKQSSDLSQVEHQKNKVEKMVVKEKIEGEAVKDKTKKFITEIQKQSVDKSTVIIQEQPVDKNIEKAEVGIQISEINPPKVSLTIAERLEKNRKYAVAQQEKAERKGQKHMKVTKEFKILDEPSDGTGKDSCESEFLKMSGTLKEAARASTIGIRNSMEDADLGVSEQLIVQGETCLFDVLGVCDGHCGNQAAKYVQENLIKFLKEALENNNHEALTDEGIFKALKKCCQNLDEDYKLYKNYNKYAGTTLTMAMILDGKIWVANVGDARTVLVKKNGETIQASEDANCTLERYKKKVEKLGGSIANNRVDGSLEVPRAIGDHDCTTDTGQKYVVPNPKITCYSLKDFEGGQIVLACDGLYDVATSDEVGTAIHEMAKKGCSLEEMSKRLVKRAVAVGSQDNVSAIVGQF